MSYLFEVIDKTVRPSTEVLLLEPFSTIWERDESEKKSQAIKEFSYIEFMTSAKKSNPFRGYKEQEKEGKIKQSLSLDDWEPDEYIKEAMEKILSFQKEASPTYNYWFSAKIAAEKMQSFFRNFDISAVNLKTFNPLYKPKDITNALKDTEDVLSRLNNLERKVEEELYEETKIKSNKEISFFANPESLL